MNEQEQRIVIAKACGREVPEWNCNEENPCFEDCSDYFNEEVSKLPDYLNDLNAMHEAEKTIPMDKMFWYLVCIESITKGMLDCMTSTTKITNVMECSLIVHATAAQRAEAFLKALNLWTD